MISQLKPVMYISSAAESAAGIQPQAHVAGLPLAVAGRFDGILKALASDIFTILALTVLGRDVDAIVEGAEDDHVLGLDLIEILV